MGENQKVIPDNVPPDLVWRHSFADFVAELDDPYCAASRLHDGPDIIWAYDTGLGRPGWIFTRYAHMEAAILDTETFSSKGLGDLDALMGEPLNLIPIEFDPPLHQIYRRILNPYFLPGAVNRLDPVVRETCDVLIAGFADRGSCEFVSEFASQFPSHIFLGLMGIPQAMLPDFLAWEHAIVHSADPAERIGAARSLLAFFDTFIEDQRGEPTTDLMRGVFAAEVDGRGLNRAEIIGICLNLYFGGIGSVIASLGWYLRHLAIDQALQQRLRDRPEDIPRAIDELVRAYSLVAVHRTVTRDIAFQGVDLRKGDHVLLPNYLASRDPRAYDRPHIVDIDRRARNLGFLTGAHTCLGMHLAKRELRIALETLLARFRNIRIPEGETYHFVTRGTLGVTCLPLTWDS